MYIKAMYEEEEIVPYLVMNTNIQKMKFSARKNHHNAQSVTITWCIMVLTAIPKKVWAP